MIIVKSVKNYVGPNIMSYKVLLSFLMLLFANVIIAQTTGFEEKYQKAIDLLYKDLPAADSISRELIEETKAKSNDTFLSKAYFLRGLVNYYQDQHTLSRYYYTKSLQSDYARTDTLFRAQIWNNMAINYEMLGQYDSALIYYTKSIDFKKRLGDTLAVANMWLNRSGLETKLGNYDQCDSFLSKALPQLKRYQDSQSIGSAYQTRGFNQAQQGNHEKAIPYYKKALAIFRKMEDKNGMAQNYGNLAYRYHDLEQYNNALNYLDSLKKLLNNYNSPKLYFKERLTRAENLLMLDKTNRAGEILKPLADKKEAMAKQGMLQHFYLAWMGWQASRGNMKKFQQTRETYRKRQDSLRKARIKQKTAELKVLHKVDKKNALLEKKDQIITIKTNRNFWLSLALGTVLTLLLVIGGLYVRNNELYKAIKHINIGSLISLKATKEIKEQGAQEEPNTIASNNLTPIFEQIQYLVKEKEWYKYHNLTVKMLAQEIGTNDLYISKAINKCSGLNFNSYLNHYRIQVAKKLLLEKGYEENGVTSIGYAVGFSNPSTFSRTFKKLTGLSPSAFYKVSNN